MDKIERISELYHEYKSCLRCPDLCKYRKNVVFGHGKVSADLMVIGEAPGETEDELGEPFIGDSGELLNSALEEAGLSRKDVYISNVVLCRPVFEETTKRGNIRLVNRTPTKAEQDACKERLYEEIYIVDPKLILLLGNIAASLVTKNKLNNVLGQMFDLKIPGKTKNSTITYPAIVNWHPAYVLRGSQERRPGTPSMQFIENIQKAVEIIKITKKISEEFMVNESKNIAKLLRSVSKSAEVTYVNKATRSGKTEEILSENEKTKKPPENLEAAATELTSSAGVEVEYKRSHSYNSATVKIRLYRHCEPGKEREVAEMLLSEANDIAETHVSDKAIQVLKSFDLDG